MMVPTFSFVAASLEGGARTMTRNRCPCFVWLFPKTTFSQVGWVSTQLDPHWIAGTRPSLRHCQPGRLGLDPA